MGRYSEACIGYIHTDFKIPVFIFRQQIYIILIYLLQRPYLISSESESESEHFKMRCDCKTFAD